MLQKKLKKIKPSTIAVYVGLDFVGDGLIKLPFIRSLRQVFPNSYITWIAGTHKSEFKHSLKPLVTGLINEVLEEINVGFIGISEAPTFKRIKDIKNLFIKPLNGRKFDLLIDTQTHFLTTLLVKCIQHRYFVSGTANFLLSDIKPNKKFVKKINLSQRLVQLAEIASGSKITVSPPPLPLDPKYRQHAKIALPSNKNYVGLAPGAGDTSKCWDLDNFISVAKYLVKKKRIPVFFLGPKEKKWLKIIKTKVPDSIFPEWGRFRKKNIKGAPFVISLAERIKCALSNDSGTAHMIDAGGCPIVKVFGRSLPGKYTGLTKDSVSIDSRKFGSTNINIITPSYVNSILDKYFK